MKKFIQHTTILKIFEHVLAAAALLAVIAMAYVSIIDIIALDWRSFDALLVVFERILYMAIGIEIARLLMSYCLDTLVELIAFVIARKILLIEGDYVGVLLSVIALIILFGARHFFYRTFGSSGIGVEK